MCHTGCSVRCDQVDSRKLPYENICVSLKFIETLIEYREILGSALIISEFWWLSIFSS